MYFRCLCVGIMLIESAKSEYGEEETMRLNMVKKYLLENYIYKVSIRTRLICYFIISVLIPTIFISTTMYWKSADIITEKTDASIEKNLITAEDIILQKFQSVQDIATLISLNTKVIEVLDRTHSADTASIMNEMTTLDAALDSFYLSNMSNLANTTILPRIYVFNRPEYNQYKFTDKVFDSSVIQNEKWYKGLSDGTRLLLGTNKAKIGYRTVDTIKIVRTMYSLKTIKQTPVGVLTIDIESKYFNNILDNFKSSKGSSIFIVDQSKDIVLSNNSDFAGKNIENIMKLKNNDNKDITYFSYIDKVDGVNMLVSVKEIPSLKWKIVSLSPLMELKQQLVSFRNIMYVLIFACVILSLFAALLLSQDVTGPVQKLVKSMSKVKTGNFQINLSYKRNDEFAFLISEYKRMVSEIKDLIERLYISELENKKAELIIKDAELKIKDAELKALQAQINPHFLYNTLDSINWLAFEYNAPDISTMVKSLSNFFRYSLNKGSNIITFEDELKQVESYLKIQKIRFLDKLDYIIDVEPTILQCYTVKLILQPIVENSIVHGIEKIKTGGHILLSGRIVDGKIVIKISDNGVGTDCEKMNSLLEDSKNNQSSFGLKNVNLRIKQFYGEEFGLSFSSNAEGGATVTVKIDMINNLEEKHV